MVSRTLVRSPREGAHVIEMQRRRLLSATVELVYEHGAGAFRVASVCERAGLSRKTFYCLYDEREELLLAAFQDTVEHARREILRASTSTSGWREQLRTGLTALLCFLDREPAAGRLIVVEALAAGEPVLQARREILAQLAAILDQGRGETKGRRQPPPLTAEGLVGAAFSLIHARILTRTQHQQQPLVELANPLMAILTGPYLGPAAAQKELEHPTTTAPTLTPRLPTDPFKDLPIRLTYRTVRTLAAIAANPGSSSKQVADIAGINDEGQTSKLLNRLKRNNLIQDTGIGPTKGQPRAWALTHRGEGVLHATRTG